MSDAMYDPIRMFTEVVENLWRPMFIANFLVLVVWAICRLGERRLPASLRCYLWRLTYVKLLLTATIGVVFCGGFPLELPPLPAHEITAMAGPPPDVIAAEPQLKSAPSTTYRIAPEPHSFLWLLHQAVCPEGVKVLSDGSGWTTDMGSYTDWLYAPNVAQTATMLYLGGSLLFLIRISRSRRRAQRLAHTAQPVTDNSAHAALAEISERLGLKRLPSLGQSESLRTPLYTNGAILLPTTGLPNGTERLILAHEAAHARRRDLIWEWLGAITQALYFFDPLVYLARREERIARESAADAVALRLTGATPADYAKMLVGLSLNAQPIATGTVGAAERGSALYRRLRALQNHSNGLSRSGVSAVFLAASALTVATVVPVTVSAAQAGCHTHLRPWQPTDDPIPHLPANPTRVSGDKRIRGVVRDSRGVPVRGVYLSLFRTFFADNMSAPIRSVMTDANGRFDFNDVPMGEYTLLSGMGAPYAYYETPAAAYGVHCPTFYITNAQRIPVEKNLTSDRP
jgi:beta-lactamase regulating signal transducer with metallopeptidase domain